MTSKLGKGLEAIIPGFSEAGLYGNINEKNIVEIDIDKIITGVYQPRKNFDAEKLQELAESIKQNGIIQPLVVVKDETESFYKLIAGERRYRASIMAGLQKVPVIIKDYTEDERLEIALIENLQREDLNAIEEAETYKLLMEKYNLTQEDISKKMQKSRPYIANILRLLNLSEYIKDMVRNGELSSAKARTILSIEDETIREKIAKESVEKNLSVKDIENYIKKIYEYENLSDENVNIIYKKSEIEKNRDFVRCIYDKFNIDKNKFFIKLNSLEKKKGTINIKFSSEEELEEILKKIN